MPDVPAVAAVVIWFLEAGALLYMSYRGFLGLLSLRPLRRLPRGSGETRFLVLVPSHNEEHVIAESVQAICAMDYPADLILLYVIADRCEDETEQRARSAGARVLVKTEPTSGKGNVIRWALAHPTIVEAAWDAVILFDADSRPLPEFLRLMDAAIVRGDRAIQGRIESHGQSGWVPTAHAMNTSQRNRTWHQAREAAGFSVALTGTGVCLTRELLRRFPLTTRTVTEDLEYYAMLTLAGIRVRYLYEAATIIDQPPSLKASIGQRIRWARGQLITAFEYAPALFWRSVRKLELSSFDTALYLFLPSIVPFQAFVILSELGHVTVGGIWPRGTEAGLPNIPMVLLLGVLTVGLVLPLIALHIERRGYIFRDWVAFCLLMLTWLPLVGVAAMTTWVGTWHHTARGPREPATGSLPRTLGAETTSITEQRSRPIERN